MAQALTEEAKAALGAMQQVVKEKLRGGLTRYMSLSGKDAIVKPGGSCVIRFLPRWDFAKQHILKDGKPVPNPAYDRKLKPFIFVGAKEHWYDDASGKRKRVLCPTNLGPREECPLCDAARGMMASEDPVEKKKGNDLKGKDFYLFNALRRVTRPDKTIASAMTDTGLPEIRIFQVPPTVWLGVTNLMKGEGDDTQFALGEIFDPLAGYDILIVRPGTDSGDRYTVRAATQPSTLYRPDEAAAFRGWPSLLSDLEAEISEDKHPTFHDLYVSYYGQEPPEVVQGAEIEPETAAPGGDNGAAEAGQDDLAAAFGFEGALDNGGGGEALPETDAGEVDADLAAFGFEMPGAEAPAAPPAPAPRAAAPAPAAGRKKAEPTQEDLFAGRARPAVPSPPPPPPPAGRRGAAAPTRRVPPPAKRK